MTSSIQPIPLTEAGVLAALRDCYDPASTVNIVDLGLVESIELAPDPDAPGSGIPGVPPRHRVRILLVAADPGVGEDSSIPVLIQSRLAAFETISATEVEISTSPVWTPERMTPEGRMRMAAHLNLNSRKPANALVTIQTGPAKA